MDELGKVQEPDLLGGDRATLVGSDIPRALGVAEAVGCGAGIGRAPGGTGDAIGVAKGTELAVGVALGDGIVADVDGLPREPARSDAGSGAAKA